MERNDSPVILKTQIKEWTGLAEPNLLQILYVHTLLTAEVKKSPVRVDVTPGIISSILHGVTSRRSLDTGLSNSWIRSSSVSVSFIDISLDCKICKCPFAIAYSTSCAAPKQLSISRPFSERRNIFSLSMHKLLLAETEFVCSTVPLTSPATTLFSLLPT